jgi:hypothetical protein
MVSCLAYYERALHGGKPRHGEPETPSSWPSSDDGRRSPAPKGSIERFNPLTNYGYGRFPSPSGSQPSRSQPWEPTTVDEVEEIAGEDPKSRKVVSEMRQEIDEDNTVWRSLTASSHDRAAKQAEIAVRHAKRLPDLPELSLSLYLKKQREPKPTQKVLILLQVQ